MTTNRHSRTRRRGQGLVEYGAVVALIAVLAIGSLGILGAATTGAFNDFTAAVNSVVTGDTTTTEGDSPTAPVVSNLEANPVVTSAGNYDIPGLRINVSYNANVAGGDEYVWYEWDFAGFRVGSASGVGVTSAIFCSALPTNPTWSLTVSDNGVIRSYSGTLPKSICDSPVVSASPVVTGVSAMVDFHGSSLPGATVSFSANASGGNGTLSYQWLFQGMPRMDNVASGTVGIPCFSLGMSQGRWVLNVTDAGGMPFSFTGTIPNVTAICGGNQ